MKRHLYLFGFLLFYLFSFSLKLNSQESFSSSNVQYLTSDDGLSQNEVTSMLQDSKGFLWIGTRGGLNRYDGSSFKIFQNEIGNTNSLNNNSIETLFEDSDGFIWIGTKSNGFTRYNPKLNKFEEFNINKEQPRFLHNKRVVSIAEGFNKDIWLGTFQNGLHIYSQKNNSSISLLKNIKVTDILKSSDNKMWVTTSYGLYQYTAKGKLINSFFVPNLEIEFTSIVEDKKTGLLYLGTWNNGLFEFNLKTEKFKRYYNQNIVKNSKNTNNTYFLFIDKDRTLWVGTWGSSLNKFNLDTKKYSNINLSEFQDKGSAELYGDVLCVYQDKLGVLWFGTNGGGVCKVNYTHNQFDILDIKKKNTNLPNEPVWSIYKDKKQHLWVGFKGNNNIYYSKTGIDYFKYKLPIAKDETSNRKLGVKTILEDKQGNFWIATNHGLYQVDRDKNILSFKSMKLRNPNNLQLEQLLKTTILFQSSNGVFWIGTQQNGLRKSVNPGNPLTQEFKTYLPNERISSVLEDKKGNIWIGTYRGVQLLKPNSKDFIKFSKILGDKNSLSSNIIISIFEDIKGNIWIGTPNGLNKVIIKNNNYVFESYQQKDGLPNNYIHSILEDDKNNLWIGTNKGISKFDVNENLFYNYDINDGLKSNSFTENTSLKDKTSKFYFGGIYGLNIFHPDSIKSKNVPTVVLTGFKIAGQEIKPGEKYNDRVILNKSIEYYQDITLNHNENIFSIDYTALGSQSASSFSYSIKMEGLDKDWYSANLQKNVIYSNLNDGKYTFKVKAISDEEIIDSPIASLNIEILPPFWKTWQAFLLYVLAFIGLLYLYRHFINKQSNLQYRLELSKLDRKKEEELAEMKTRFFTDIAHEIRTPLSLISGPLETLIEENLNKEQQTSYLTTINYHTKRLLTLVSQLLDFRKAESGKMTLQVAKGDIIHFSREIFLSFRELAKSKNINFEHTIEEAKAPLTFDSNKMEIVLCNLLSNAFKFTPNNGNVVLSVKQDTSTSKDFPNGFCEIRVTDDGAGLTEEMTQRIFNRFYQVANTKSINVIGTGIGLALVKSIVELHEGKVFVESVINKGSVFVIQIPLGETHFNKDQFIVDYKKSEDATHYQVERILEKRKAKPVINILSEKRTLLIVEDNPEIRSFVRSVFENRFKIIEAENGKIGFNKALEHNPNIIISDLMMPEMDGLALCNKLRETEETLHIPIILLTARTTTVFQEEGYNSGADIYVTKPFTPSVLKAQVEGLINSRQKLRDLFGKKITLQADSVEETSLDEKFLNKAIKIVEENLTNEKLNRDFLAAHLATSSSTLYRKIKGLTGFDTTVFVRSIRLKKAAQMILNKEDNISGIAYQVGFNDLKYFRKCFKEQFGVTPSKFTKDLL
ncbi:hybrid sensor histidine kinase/response regulator transcription factor [Polaribacter atrinae]|uniref:hybrid sensor histidine kinase/response regulator transcription factor n=1 Tax=Polaribacter atrinae TaxID=1333662 RepID=UPI00248F63B2|nr:two-component regulator propeller domain-containing protein [Polaribacter atrinae]